METLAVAPGQTGTVIFRTRGRQHGSITRLMSPSDLGEELKPFVFLDLFDFDDGSAVEMPLHPHSGIATVTVFTEGEMQFEDPSNGTGTIGYGGVEWMRSGGGVWHGKEMRAGSNSSIKGFQLWLALPPELENAAADPQYLEAKAVPEAGPARVILGSHEGVQSPVRSPGSVNYLLVTLTPGERWAYPLPTDHGQLWLALASGTLAAHGSTLHSGEMALLAQGDRMVELAAGPEGAVFVLGSAVPHPHDLVLGYYSVHTSAATLAQGEARIEELGRLIRQSGIETSAGTIPVFAG